MLACVTDCDEIAQNPCNTSGSKQLFSFSKQRRFDQYRKPYNNLVSYEKKSDFSARKIFGKSNGFGCASRPELFPQKEQIQKPPPDSYNLDTAFKPLNYVGLDKKVRSSTAKRLRGGKGQLLSNFLNMNTSPPRKMDSQRATTFGVSREAFNKVVSPSKRNYQPHDRALPGPGQYQPDMTQVEQTLKYSLRPRTQKELFKILNTPGPGTYAPVDGINIDGMYAASGHMRTKTPNMMRSTSNGPTKYDRIPAKDRYKPGPGWYDHGPQTMSMSVLKKAMPLTQEKQVSGFGTDSRKVFISTSYTPGPGAYVAPSAFGQYVGEKALLNTSDMVQERSCSRSKRHSQMGKRDSYSDVKRLINKTFSAEKQIKKLARSRQQNSGAILEGMPGKPIFYTGMSEPDLSNLTVMEKKILRKLKETARGKTQIKPVKQDTTKNSTQPAKKLYLQHRPSTKSTGSRTSKNWPRKTASPLLTGKQNKMKFSMGNTTPNTMASQHQPLPNNEYADNQAQDQQQVDGQF